MGRRTYKTGSVYESPKGSGTWWAQVRLGPNQFRRARCASRQEADRQTARWVKELEAGADLRAARSSLRAWLERWLAGLEAEGSVVASTLEFYARHAGYATPHIGHHALEALEPQHWRDARVKLLRDGLARRSVNHVHSVLHNALERAVRDGAILTNPMKRVDKLPLGKEKFEARVLEDEEITALERACEGERLGPMLLFILTFGVRHSEARNLKWSDVDLERGCFYVADSKTKAGRRRIHLTASWVAGLAQQRAVVAEERATAERRTLEEAKKREQAGEPLELRHRWRDHGLVFPSEVGTVLGEQNVTKVKQRILQKAGLCDPCLDCGQTGKLAGGERCERCVGRGAILWRIRIHDLRHTAITAWIAEGEADPKTAQGMAGHATSSTTLDIYAKSRDTRQREVLERVEHKRRKRAGDA